MILKFKTRDLLSLVNHQLKKIFGSEFLFKGDVLIEELQVESYILLTSIISQNFKQLLLDKDVKFTFDKPKKQDLKLEITKEYADLINKILKLSEHCSKRIFFCSDFRFSRDAVDKLAEKYYKHGLESVVGIVSDKELSNDEIAKRIWGGNEK